MATGSLSFLFCFVAGVFDKVSEKEKDENTDSNSFDMTVPLDESFTEIDTIHGRDYQRYSLQNNVYLSPIDEVLSAPLCGDRSLASSGSKKRSTKCKPSKLQDVSLLTCRQVEVQRLRDAHKAFSKVFDYRLIFPPVNRPRKVLDCGSGTGAWAAEVAAEYPGCKVSGFWSTLAL